MNELALMCRVGFEADLIDELAHWYAQAQAAATLRSDQPGVVRVSAATLLPRCSELVYARDCIVVHQELPALDTRDRLTPITAALAQAGLAPPALVLAPDSEATKPLAPLLGALATRLQPGGAEAGSARVWMLSGTHALIGSTPPAGGAVYPGGVPRLKFPREAPSRSTLKLEEAFHVLMNASERHTLLRAGGSAVDLGAAPGGWTWQLVARRIRVTAIDNGRIDQRLLDSGLVQHLAEDGFRYRPPKPVDWLVCDMVEKPARVVELMLRWFASGWCRAAIFNLKLPMKRRFEAWLQARQTLQPLQAAGYSLRARQLYHDREEITVAVLPPRGRAPQTIVLPTQRAAPAARSSPPAPSGKRAPPVAPGRAGRPASKLPARNVTAVRDRRAKPGAPGPRKPSPGKGGRR